MDLILASNLEHRMERVATEYPPQGFSAMLAENEASVLASERVGVSSQVSGLSLLSEASIQFAELGDKDRFSCLNEAIDSGFLDLAVREWPLARRRALPLRVPSYNKIQNLTLSILNL
ncbi:unnamed protein product [Dovyalis caffra]|uniref:Uncharacterized protein n=1 Tax=Dovyalis caffra TaxID=77055 RepID=A0AAV1RNE5_9ROSI|nr:unnamed protein product [Dovyalis caffra]